MKLEPLINDYALWHEYSNHSLKTIAWCRCWRSGSVTTAGRAGTSGSSGRLYRYNAKARTVVRWSLSKP